MKANLQTLEQKHYYWEHREDIHDKIDIAQDMLHLISQEFHTEKRTEEGTEIRMSGES